MSDWLEFWNYTSADWVGLQFAVLVAAALVAWRQVTEAASLRTEQARPFVVVDAEIERKHVMLTVTNLGRTVARNVKIEFEPALVSSLEDEWQFYLPIQDTKIFQEGIPSLPPGKRYGGVFDNLPSREGSGLPDEYTATVHYEGAPGRSRFTDTFVLDLGLTKNLLQLKSAAESPDSGSAD